MIFRCLVQKPLNPQRSVWELRKQRSASTGIALMPEMSHSGEDHGDAMFVAGGDHFVIIL
jgi:hypothetical protein